MNPALLIPLFLSQPAPTLEGVWVEDKELSESADALLATQGVPWPIRKLINAGTASEEIRIQDDRVDITVRVSGATRELGGPLDGSSNAPADAQDSQETWTLDGNTLLQVQTKTTAEHTHELRVTRSIVGSDRMLVEMELRVDGELEHRVRQIYRRS